MDDAIVALSLARGRIAFGATTLLAPRLAARVMGAGRTPRGTTPLLARMLGGRDIALGLGTVIATFATMPFIVNASGDGVTPGAALAIAIAPETKLAKGELLAFGLGTANVAT